MPVHTELPPLLGPSSALPRTERGLDTLRPRSRGDHGSRHGASHTRQHSTKLPCAGTWRSGSPRPPLSVPGTLGSARGLLAPSARLGAAASEPPRASVPPAPLCRPPEQSGSRVWVGGAVGQPPLAPCAVAAWTLTPAPACPGWHSCTQGARAERQRELSTCPALLSALRSGAGPGGAAPRGPGGPGTSWRRAANPPCSVAASAASALPAQGRA